MTPASGARHTLGFARPSSNLLLPHFVALRRCFHPSPLLFVSFQAFVTDPGEGLGFTSPWKEPLEAAQGSGRSTVGQGSHPGSWSCPAAGSWQRGQSRGCSGARGDAGESPVPVIPASAFGTARARPAAATAPGFPLLPGVGTGDALLIPHPSLVSCQSRWLIPPRREVSAFQPSQQPARP